MQPEVWKERAEKYGSSLFCPEKETICFHINTPNGICERTVCCKDDPEYIEQQIRIEEKRNFLNVKLKRWIRRHQSEDRQNRELIYWKNKS